MMSEDWEKLPTDAKNLLDLQHLTMTTYSHILKLRIKSFDLQGE